MNKTTKLFKMLVLSLAIIACIGMLLVSCGDDTSDGSTGSSSEETNSSTAPSSTVDSSDPGTTNSSDPGTTNSSDLGTTDSSDPGTTDSSDPGTTESSDQGTTNPSDPGTTDSSDPGEVDKPCEHSFELTNTVAATCQAEGSETYTCSKCGGTKVETLPIKENHNYTELVESVEASCKDGSYDVYKCEWCDETENRVTGEPTSHSYVTDETAVEGTHYVVEASTCITEGKKIYKCTSCGENATDEEYIETIPCVSHQLEYSRTVRPTCQEVGHKLYKCTVDPNCGLTWKNPDLNTPNEPLPEDIVPMVDHSYDEPTADGLVACYMCGTGYRDVTSEKLSGSVDFCMGCGKEPCECGATNEWNGYGPAKAPEQLTANTEFTKSEVALTDSTVALEIGNGMIMLVGTEETTYTIKLYDKVDGELLDTLEVAGNDEAIYVKLEGYATVGMVKITATTDATVSFYAPAE